MRYFSSLMNSIAYGLCNPLKALMRQGTHIEVNGLTSDDREASFKHYLFNF